MHPLARTTWYTPATNYNHFTNEDDKKLFTQKVSLKFKHSTNTFKWCFFKACKNCFMLSWSDKEQFQMCKPQTMHFIYLVYSIRKGRNSKHSYDSIEFSNEVSSVSLNENIRNFPNRMQATFYEFLNFIYNIDSTIFRLKKKITETLFFPEVLHLT